MAPKEPIFRSFSEFAGLKLVKCPVCGNQVAGTAATCPQCGHRLRRPVVAFFGFLFIAFCALYVYGSLNPPNDATSTSLTSGAALIGEWGVVHATIGCPSVEDLTRIGDMLRGGDKIAAGTLASEHCDVISESTEAMIEDWSVLHDAKCVRPRGSTECLWVRTQTVAAKQRP